MKIRITDDVCISFNKELMLNILLCIVWAALLLKFVRGVVIRIPQLSESVDEVLIVLVSFFTFLALPAAVNRFSLADYLFFLLNAFYLVACYAFFPENTVYLDDNILKCIFCIFTYYFVGRLIDIDKFFDVFLLLSTVCIVLDLYYNIVYMPANKVMDESVRYDNMDGAYKILPHVMMLLWAMLERFRVWKAVVFLAGILYILSCGTRGPFVCLGFFGIIYFFFFMKFRGAIYVKIGIVMAALLLLINLENVLIFLARTFTDLKLSTRILEKVITGELGDDSYRSILREKLRLVVSDGEHFWGLGAFGCRNYGIIYPHFLPLDFVCTYGYFLGYILLFLLVALIGYALWVSRGTKRQIFILFLFSLSIIKLLLSNSFLLEPYFYMLVGVCAKEVVGSIGATGRVALYKPET